MPRYRALLSFCAAALSSLAVLPGCVSEGATFAEQQEIRFAKKTYEKFVRGDSDVLESLDTATFELNGRFILFETLPVAQALEPARTDAVNQLREILVGVGAARQSDGKSFDRLVHWRVTEADSAQTIIIADDPGYGGVRLTLSKRDGVMRLRKIDDLVLRS